MREHKYTDAVSLAEALAASIAETLTAALDSRGVASLVLSGGRTPQPLLESLAEQGLPWDAIWVTLADERWVATTSSESNENMVRRCLLEGRAAGARFVGLKTDDVTPEAGREVCEQALSSIPAPYDVVVLGMGGDGHTASLFPRSDGLCAALDPVARQRCVAIRPPAAPHARMTQTLAALTDSRWLVLHLTGAEKWQVYRHVVSTETPDELPIGTVLRHARAPVDIYWAP